MVNCVLSPKYSSHERYEELCALAAIGEISAAEFAELNEHLAGCGECSEMESDFRRIASNELGAVATARAADYVIPDLDEPAIYGRVLQRAQAETNQPEPPELQPMPIVPPKRKLFGGWNPFATPVLVPAMLLLFVCAGVAIGYRLRDRQPDPAFDRLNAQLTQRQDKLNEATALADSASTKLNLDQSERQRLLAQLDDAQKNYADTLSLKKSLEAELADARLELQKTSEELRDVKAAGRQSEGSVQLLQAQLHEAALHTQAQEVRIDRLQHQLRETEDASVAAVAPEIQSGDARQVFGARDLHIVDVYDVDATGKNRRSFGRVYFVEKKLLLFYAFDLQDKQRQRVASAFQAWGYKQGNENKPQNLGLFLVDDASVGRWVLKVNDSSVLQRIDAVFVTLEPPDGSPAPRGRKLLYANLGGPPNHP